MAKDINDYLILNKEEQILVNKLNKNFSLLSKKTDKYFEKEKIISSDAIKDAFLSKKNYLIMNKEALDLVDDWRSNIEDFQNNYQKKSKEYTKEFTTEVFIFDKVKNKNLDIVLNTINCLGKIYLKKDKKKVLNQLQEIFVERTNGYENNLDSILDKYVDSLKILEQSLLDDRLLKIETNYNDVIYLAEVNKLETKWKVFDNKHLLMMISILIFVIIISIIIAICVIVI